MDNKFQNSCICDFFPLHRPLRPLSARNDSKYKSFANQLLEFSADLILCYLQKYFDSGDYNMAKAKMKNKQLPTAAPDKTEVTGDHIPTPQDLPQRKPSLVASKLAG
ncbi:cAMP-regulated phosphoprotein 19 isoform X3 [Strix uralensis]|uniref:cAMP-regulated phosphoprotein 19 isoform X3 n=1 Tax=Strix uralensis TaxID=36305 RepID=UPI003DA20495